MVSEKMRELGTKKSTIREIFEYGRKRAQEVGEENICDFSLGNPNVPAPDFIKQAVLAIMTEMEPQAVHGYTVAPGNPAVRETLAASINERFGTHFSGRNLFMTAGAAAAITVCFKALAEEGDEFIAFAPFFPEYRCFVASVGAIAGAITGRTAGVIVNSPNNPSGAVYSEETIKALAALLRRKQQEYDHPIFLISDEPYREIAYGCEVPYITKYYENTLVCYSYSKSFSLAGERIGYIVVPDEVADFSSVYGAVAGAARVLTHVNAPSLWQLVVARCARLSSDITPYEKNGTMLYEGLVRAGFSCVKPQGAFYLFPRSLEADDYAFCERAKKYDLLLVPGTDFGCPGHFRASYCIEEQTIERSLPLFEKLAKEYGV